MGDREARRREGQIISGPDTAANSHRPPYVLQSCLAAVVAHIGPLAGRHPSTRELGGAEWRARTRGRRLSVEWRGESIACELQRCCGCVMCQRCTMGEGNAQESKGSRRAEWVGAVSCAPRTDGKRDPA